MVRRRESSDFGLRENEGGLTGAPAEGSIKAARLSLFFLPGRIRSEPTTTISTLAQAALI
jgi:hypothetical protein